MSDTFSSEDDVRLLDSIAGTTGEVNFQRTLTRIFKIFLKIFFQNSFISVAPPYPPDSAGVVGVNDDIVAPPEADEDKDEGEHEEDDVVPVAGANQDRLATTGAESSSSGEEFSESYVESRRTVEVNIVRFMKLLLEEDDTENAVYLGMRSYLEKPLWELFSSRTPTKVKFDLLVSFMTRSMIKKIGTDGKETYEIPAPGTLQNYLNVFRSLCQEKDPIFRDGIKLYYLIYIKIYNILLPLKEIILMRVLIILCLKES